MTLSSTATMTIYTVTISSTFLPLLCALLSTSVLGRHHFSQKVFVPKNNPTAASSPSLPVSSLLGLGTSAFSSERDAQIHAARVSPLVFATKLCRGGYQNDDDYNYDDRGYNRNNDDHYSNQYGNDYYQDDYYPSHDRGSSYDDREEGSRFGPPSFSMPDIIRTGNKKIGLPVLAIGGALTILGASLFFNKTLMRLGNLFFVAGVPLTIGPGRTAGYFFQPKKARATSCLAAGVILVFVGWPIFGIILEVFGLLNLFGNMFPMALMIMKQMPVIGPLLKGNVGKNNNNNDRYSGARDRYDDSDGYRDDRDRYDDGDPYYNDRGYPDDDDNRYF